MSGLSKEATIASVEHCTNPLFTYEDCMEFYNHFAENYDGVSSTNYMSL